MKDERIISPSPGSIITCMGGHHLNGESSDDNKKHYPCDVYIVSGQYLSNGRVSNFWTWRRILSSGKLGPEANGYGDFVSSKNKYEVDIVAKKL